MKYINLFILFYQAIVKKNESIEAQERSRHSLTRLAKSRHSFLSKVIIFQY